MPEIDYAFLADFAKVEPTGTLTVVGASYMFVNAPQLPTAHRLAIAGRIRARADDGTVPIRITIAGPEGTFEIATEGELDSSTAEPYGDGYVGLLFALDLQVPLPAAGTYWVEVMLTGSDDRRRLAFEVRHRGPEA
ncbi:DUF6941 family protein [Nocardioides sp. SYSU DS0663]|uniref:DUF6941 family protein n=1 Tax=Nocardioides sp. SYSU DS0663 TaxID=3416445 RepID=UPI003F4BCB13